MVPECPGAAPERRRSLTRLTRPLERTRCATLSAALRAPPTARPSPGVAVTTALTPGLDPGLAAMLETIERLGLPRMGEGTPAEARAAFRRVTCDIRARRARRAGGLASRTASCPGPRDRCGRAPTGPPAGRAGAAGAVPTVLFLHGGGWVIGDLDTHDNQARRLAATRRRRRLAGLPPGAGGRVPGAGARRLGGAALGGRPRRRARRRRRRGWRSAATARAATSPPSWRGGRATPAGPRWPRSCCCTRASTSRRTRTYPSREENREGYLLGPRGHGVVRRALRRRVGGGRRPLTDPDLSPLHAADLRRRWRRRSSSSRSSTRCATRASRTPRRWPRPARRSTLVRCDG